MPSCRKAEYRQHRPEETPLFPLIRDNLEGFLHHCRSTYKRGIPRYAEKELREYLKCGIAAHGFARARCQACGHELLLTFSCKRRGVCPSCNARRMSDTAARLVDHVLPEVRLRQWVLSVPFELRMVFAKNPDALSTCGRIFVEETFRWQRSIGSRWGLVPATEAQARLRGGAVCFPQRFGGSLNLNVHYHVVVPDAVFFRDSTGVMQRELLSAPTRGDLAEIAHNVSVRVLRWLARKGLIEDGEESDIRSAPTALDVCLGSSIGLGDLATLKGDKLAKSEHHSADSVSKRARRGEFNIHASVTATAREDRERLVRYCARAPLSLERLSVARCGKVVYQLKSPIHGRTHRVMEPYQFLARLCALIPPPRHPLIRFHGVLAPNSSWRKEVVPAASHAGNVPEPEPHTEIATPSAELSVEKKWNAARLDWATLLKRVYNIDALACPCGGRLTFIELIEDKKEATAQLIARGLYASVAPLPQKPPPPAADHIDELPEEDWDQSREAFTFIPDPIWDDP